MYDQFNFYYLHKKIDQAKYIIATFSFSAPKLKFKDAVHAIAGESSIGTWTKIGGLTKARYKQLAPKIIWENRKKHMVKIAYPLALFELGNVPQLLSSLAGNIFSMKVVERLRLLDIEFPKQYIQAMPGPKFGIPGIRNKLKVKQRPLVGSIIKPKVGRTAKQHAQATYDLWCNGVDVVKDDENLTDMSFNRFKDRVDWLMKFRKIAEQKTGEQKMAIINISAPYNTALKRAKYIKQKGGKCMMVDIVSMGWSAVQSLRQENLGLIIHGHRAGHSMFTRDETHGMTMYVVAKLSRMCGIDQLHTGTVVGKMEGGSKEVIKIDEFIRSEWGNLKPTIPIASGGLWPGLVPGVMKYIGKDVIINFGGGIFGHPDGRKAGAKAARQVVEGITAGKTLKQLIKDDANKELNAAVKFWGKK